MKVVLEEARASRRWLGKRNDHFVHGRGGWAVHRIAGNSLGRYVHVRRHRGKPLRKSHHDGARRRGGPGATVTGLLVAIPAILPIT